MTYFSYCPYDNPARQAAWLSMHAGVVAREARKIVSAIGPVLPIPIDEYLSLVLGDRHYCRVDNIQFNIEPDVGMGKVHLRVRSEFDPEKLLVALLQDPMVREATILKDLRPALL